MPFRIHPNNKMTQEDVLRLVQEIDDGSILEAFGKNGWEKSILTKGNRDGFQMGQLGRILKTIEGSEQAYRIQPKRKELIRPWRREEAMGKIVRELNGRYEYQITAVSDITCYLPGYLSTWIFYKQLLTDFVAVDPNCKWKTSPCGVEIDEAEARQEVNDMKSTMGKPD